MRCLSRTRCRAYSKVDNVRFSSLYFANRLGFCNVRFFPATGRAIVNFDIHERLSGVTQSMHVSKKFRRRMLGCVHEIFNPRPATVIAPSKPVRTHTPLHRDLKSCILLPKSLALCIERRAVTESLASR